MLINLFSDASWLIRIERYIIKDILKYSIFKYSWNEYGYQRQVKQVNELMQVYHGKWFDPESSVTTKIYRDKYLDA